jgi:type IV secretion system protein VirB10
LGWRKHWQPVILRFILKASQVREMASELLNSVKDFTMRRLFYFRCAAILGVTLGLTIAAAAQEAGPMPPAPATQPAPQNPQSPQNPGPSTQAPSTPTPPQPQPSGIPNTSGATSGNADATATTAAATPPPAAKPVAKIEVPSGTHIPLVIHNSISTRSARPGDPVYFETLFPVMIDGKVVIPAGSYVSGEVTESKRPGLIKGRGEFMIKLTTLILPNAYMVNLNATPSNAGTGGNETTDSEGKIVGDSEKGHDVGTIAKTTAAGAGIGSIATRSGTGAGIGAAAGAAVGLAAVLLTRGPEAEMPRGSTVEAVIDRSIYLDADKVQFTTPGQASSLAGPPNREPVRNKDPF